MEDKETLGQFFYEYFGFTCQAFHRSSSTSIIITRGSYNRPVVAPAIVNLVPLDLKIEK
jgi:hypothetical protein